MNKLYHLVIIVNLCLYQSIAIATNVTEEQFSTGSHNNSHIVIDGDSLFSIALKNNVSVEELKRWNRLEDVNNLVIGETISLNPLNKIEEVENKNKTVNKSTIKSDIQQAKEAFSQKNYPLAITLLNRLYKQGNEAEKQFSLEYLGVAQEKQKKYSYAKQAYKLFLKNFPESENASRVDMRLANLIGIETLSKDRSLKTTKRKGKKTSYIRGSISSDYRRSLLVDDKGNSRDTLSLGSFDLDSKGSFEQDGYNVGFRASIGHYQDFLPDSNKTNDQIRYLNISVNSDDDFYQVTLGRQRSRGKGIFGRFDGLLLSSEVQTDIQVNAVIGYPVASSKITSLDKERQFYGLSVDVDNSWENMDFSLFIFEQTINNLTDRRAVGGEFNYFKDLMSVHSLIDYDIFFNELNALLFTGSYSTQTKQRYSWSVNYKKSPYVGTRNALIGQSVDSFAELQNLFITDEEILDLALDRTLTSKMASFQYFQPLNENFDISTSLTWMNLSSAPGSGGVPAISESGDQLYANIYLSARKLYSKNDYNSFGVRYSSLASSSVYSLYANTRYRFDNGISLSPKLRFDSRKNDNGTSQQSISPTLRLQYQTKQHYLYTDLGGIFYNVKPPAFTSQKTSIYFMYLGYRYYFGS